MTVRWFLFLFFQIHFKKLWNVRTEYQNKDLISPVCQIISFSNRQNYVTNAIFGQWCNTVPSWFSEKNGAGKDCDIIYLSFSSQRSFQPVTKQAEWPEDFVSPNPHFLHDGVKWTRISFLHDLSFSWIMKILPVNGFTLVPLKTSSVYFVLVGQKVKLVPFERNKAHFFS